MFLSARILHFSLYHSQFTILELWHYDHNFFFPRRSMEMIVQGIGKKNKETRPHKNFFFLALCIILVWKIEEMDFLVTLYVLFLPTGWKWRWGMDPVSDVSDPIIVSIFWPIGLCLSACILHLTLCSLCYLWQAIGLLASLTFTLRLGNILSIKPTLMIATMIVGSICNGALILLHNTISSPILSIIAAIKEEVRIWCNIIEFKFRLWTFKLSDIYIKSLKLMKKWAWKNGSLANIEPK